MGRAAAGHWVSGEAKPNPAKRAILHALYDIEPQWWDEPPVRAQRGKSPADAPTSAAEPPPVVAPQPGDVMAYVVELESMAVTLMRKVKEDVGATPLEQSRVMTQIAQTLSLIAKINGSFDLGSRITRLPIWKRIEAALAKALDGYPEAAAAVAREFRELEAHVR